MVWWTMNNNVTKACMYYIVVYTSMWPWCTKDGFWFGINVSIFSLFVTDCFNKNIGDKDWNKTVIPKLIQKNQLTLFILHFETHWSFHFPQVTKSLVRKNGKKFYFQAAGNCVLIFRSFIPFTVHGNQIMKINKLIEFFLQNVIKTVYYVLHCNSTTTVEMDTNEGWNHNVYFNILIIFLCINHFILVMKVEKGNQSISKNQIYIIFLMKVLTRFEAATPLINW